MNAYGLFIAWYTLVRKEVVRGFRLWAQNFLPAAVTSALYFLIFGEFLGSRIGDIHGVAFVSFVIPGLMMLSAATSTFEHVAFIFFGAKFFNRNINEILVSPTPPWVIIAAFITSGMIRGLLIGSLVLLVSLFFAPFQIHNIFIAFLFLALGSLVFGLAGLINGVYAKNWDSINIVPVFVLTPLIYLGGIFYSVQALPEFWQKFTLYNPVFYIINGLRYGLLGTADVSLWTSFFVLLLLALVFLGVAWYLIRKGLGLKQ